MYPSHRHNECGEEIFWVRKDNYTWNPPLEYAGQAYIFTAENGAVYVPTYQRHYCDPERIKLWQEELKRVAQVEEEDKERKSDYEEVKRRAWEKALIKKCPKCSAKKKKHCINLAVLKRKGEELSTKWPHPERYVEDAI